MSGKAVHELTGERADEGALKVLSSGEGFGAPIDEMTADDRKNYYQVSNYLDRGCYHAVFRTLEALLGFAEVSGSDGSTQTIAGETWLIMTSVTFSESLIDRWIWIGGRDKLCKVRSAEVYTGAGGGSRVKLYDFDGGPNFEDHGLAPGTSQIEYSILPFRFEIDGSWSSGFLDSAGILRIWIYYSGDNAVSTFLMDDVLGVPVLITDGRPVAGKLMADEATSGEDVDGLKIPFFVLNRLEPKVEAVIRDVAPAGVRIVVYQVA